MHTNEGYSSTSILLQLNKEDRKLVFSKSCNIPGLIIYTNKTKAVACMMLDVVDLACMKGQAIINS